jgi:hypothetical protein
MNLEQEATRIQSLTNVEFNVELARFAGWTDIKQHKRFGWRGINPVTGQVTSLPSYAHTMETVQQLAEILGQRYPRVSPVMVYDPAQSGWFVNLIEKDLQNTTISDIQGADSGLPRAFGGAVLLEYYLQMNSTVKGE